MAEAHDKEKQLYQNLVDAQCSGELVEDCMALKEKNLLEQMLCKLSKHRTKLLNEIHQQQKALDCLDYLIYQIEGEVKK